MPFIFPQILKSEGGPQGGVFAPLGEGVRGASSPPPSPVTLIDGGMGQELLRRSGEDPHPLWATRVMIDHPGLVQSIHADYFAAGASVATTNTYALFHDRLVKFALDGGSSRDPSARWSPLTGPISFRRVNRPSPITAPSSRGWHRMSMC